MFSQKITPKPSRFAQNSLSTGNRYGNTSFGPISRPPITPRSLMLNRSLQTSELFDDNAMHLETYGGSLPVAVTEALAFADRHAPPSLAFDESGWGKLVAGRKLLIWKYKNNAGKMSVCTELSLPASKKVHHVGLISLIVTSSDPVPSCVAVTPTGVIRHWPRISHENTYGDVTVEMTTDICVKAMTIEVDTQEFQCIIATEFSTFIIVTPVTGKNQVHCRTVKPADNSLMGIGRRMSSFIFGGAQANPVINRFHAMSVCEPTIDGPCFFALSGNNLQKWLLLGDTEKILYSANIEQLFSDSMCQQIWHQDSDQLSRLKVWLLDIQSSGDTVLVLGAAYNPEVSPQVYYGLGTLHTDGQDAPRSFLSFDVPQFTYDQTDDEAFLKLKILKPDPSSSTVFLHEPKSVTITSASGNPDRIEFNVSGDKILGHGQCDKRALFFSNTHGLVAVVDQSQDNTVNISVRDQSLAADMSRLDEHPSFMMSATKIEEMSMSDDNIQRLKSAFLQFLRSNTHDAQLTVDTLFPPGDSQTMITDSLINTLVSALSEELLNDVPGQDPRWAEAVPQDIKGSSSSLILIYQLEDKVKAHDMFIRFLHTMGLWNRLSTITVRNNVMPTTMLLCEHAEKLITAKQLRELHMQHTAVVDAVVKTVLQARGVTSFPSGLTENDIFYREVVKVDEIVSHFVEFEMEYFSSPQATAAQTTSLIETVSNLIYTILSEAHQYRDSRGLVFDNTAVEIIPWTSALREVLCQQHKIICEEALSEVQDDLTRAKFFQQLFEFTDMILEGYKIQLDSIKQHFGESERFQDVISRYNSCRSDLLRPFMTHKQYERAASLAEKYCDYDVLVTVCEETENQERLQRYMEHFQNMGFSDFVFRWYVEQGKRGKLMTSSLASHPQLSSFLQRNDNKFMSWIHDIQAGDYFRAHDTLQQLGNQEKSYLDRKKKLLSMSKLAALVTDDPPTDRIKEINYELDLILHQEHLPEEVTEHLSMDAENMPVIPAKELIELYVSDSNVNANEFDFKKALDLLLYVDQHDSEIDKSRLLVHIWSKAILKDDWSQIGTDDPLENNKHTIFYKTLELAHADEGLNLGEQLPSADALLSSEELADICADKNIQFLLRAQLENIHRILSTHIVKFTITRQQIDI